MPEKRSGCDPKYVADGLGRAIVQMAFTTAKPSPTDQSHHHVFAVEALHKMIKDWKGLLGLKGPIDYTDAIQKWKHDRPILAREFRL